MPSATLTAVQRVLTQTATGFAEYVASTLGGTSNAYNLLALNGSGLIDASVLPPGVMADTATATAAAALTAGQLVNLYNSGTTGSPVFAARPADASSGYKAHGFVLAAFASGATGVTVYLSGLNTAVTGLAPGDVFLGTSGATATAGATTAGQLYQNVGVATAAGVLQFDPNGQTTLRS